MIKNPALCGIFLFGRYPKRVGLFVTSPRYPDNYRDHCGLLTTIPNAGWLAILKI